MKNKIIELRSMLPIPIAEAKQMLIDNDGDIETCVLLYTAKAIKIISEATEASKDVADKHYRKENFDINRAISAIKDEIYDQNYQPIEGVNKASLQIVKDWIYAMESQNFGYSLSYKRLKQVASTLILIPNLKDIGILLQEVESVYSEIFKDYNDNQPLEEFVRLNVQLDDSPIFQKANSLIPLQVLYIKNEISKHWRNV